jgi:large subunit ribosomal protein L7/L12
MNRTKLNESLTQARLRARALAMAIRGHFSTSLANDAEVLEMLANDYARSLDELQDASEAVAVVLVAAGECKLEVVKQVRALTGLGLKETKELVEAAPTVVKRDVFLGDAYSMMYDLEKVGATTMLV